MGEKKIFENVYIVKYTIMHTMFIQSYKERIVLCVFLLVSSRQPVKGRESKECTKQGKEPFPPQSIRTPARNLTYIQTQVQTQTETQIQKQIQIQIQTQIQTQIQNKNKQKYKHKNQNKHKNR